jgi:hypothetical protein
MFAGRLAASEIEFETALLERVVTALDFSAEGGEVVGGQRIERRHQPIILRWTRRFRAG